MLDRVAVTPFRAFQSTCTLLAATTTSRTLRIQFWRSLIRARWPVACQLTCSIGRKLGLVELHIRTITTTIAPRWTISSMKLCRRLVEPMLASTRSRVEVESRRDQVLRTPNAALTTLQTCASAPPQKYTTHTSITNALATKRVTLLRLWRELTPLDSESATDSTKIWPQIIRRRVRGGKIRKLCTQGPLKSWNRLIEPTCRVRGEVSCQVKHEVWHQQILLCQNVAVHTRRKASKEACFSGLIELHKPLQLKTKN